MAIARIPRAELLAKLELVAPALATIDTAPALQNFLFTGTQLIAYNDHIGIATALQSDFQGAVNGKQLQQQLNIADYAKGFKLQAEAQHALVSALGKTAAGQWTKLKAEVALPLLPPAEYTRLFTMPAAPRDGYEPDAAFFTAIDNCLISVSKYETNVEHLGVTLVPDGDTLTLYSTDRTTLTRAKLKGHEQLQRRVTLSLEFCEQLVKLRDASNRILRIDPDHALYAADDTLVLGRLLAVEQPTDYARILKAHLPNGFPHGMPAPTATEREPIRLALEWVNCSVPDSALNERTDIKVEGGNLSLLAANVRRGEAKNAVRYKAHPDAQCTVVLDRVLRGFARYESMLVRDEVVLMATGDNVYLVSALRAT